MASESPTAHTQSGTGKAQAWRVGRRGDTFQPRPLPLGCHPLLFGTRWEVGDKALLSSWSRLSSELTVVLSCDVCCCCGCGCGCLGASLRSPGDEALAELESRGTLQISLTLVIYLWNFWALSVAFVYFFFLKKSSITQLSWGVAAITLAKA